jgi:hypothetical protein
MSRDRVPRASVVGGLPIGGRAAGGPGPIHRSRGIMEGAVQG